MKIVSALLVFLTASSLAVGQNQIDTTQKVVADRRNSLKQQEKPYLIVISSDGFRYDYAEKYHAENLLKLAGAGVQAESMIPSYPSVTFPNHYSIATGLYPSHHGLVNNFYWAPDRNAKYAMNNNKVVRDGSWYGGTPLWVLAEKQQMLSASFYWVGSEANVQGIAPTYGYNYSDKIPMNRRIQIVKEWLTLPADRRPHLIMFYLPEPDHAAHVSGPNTPETERAVNEVDEAMAKLVSTVKSTGLPVSFIFLSDHGMTAPDIKNMIPMPAGVDTSKFIIPDDGTMSGLYAKDPSYISDAYETLKASEDASKYHVYLKKDVPKYLHYGAKDDRFNHIGDIIMIPEWPNLLHFSTRKPSIGWHGYDPYKVKEMHATFFAFGPAFKERLKIPSFENVNVYPIVSRVLGLKYSDIDGKKKVARRITK